MHRGGRYDPRHYLLFTVDLPVTFQVEEASKEKPYFGFRLGLDPALVASIVMEWDTQIIKGDAITKAMNGEFDRRREDASPARKRFEIFIDDKDNCK